MAFVFVVVAQRQHHCTEGNRGYKMWESRAQGSACAFSLDFHTRILLGSPSLFNRTCYLRHTKGNYKGIWRCWKCEQEFCPQH